MLMRHAASISSSYSTFKYLATVVLVITYTIITIQPSLFCVENDEVFKSFAWVNQ